MHNYLNILLIIITLFVASCTKNTTETYQVDYENQFDGNIDYKYKHLYNSLYVNIALERDLKEDALKTFVDFQTIGRFGAQAIACFNHHAGVFTKRHQRCFLAAMAGLNGTNINRLRLTAIEQILTRNEMVIVAMAKANIAQCAATGRKIALVVKRRKGHA